MLYSICEFRVIGLRKTKFFVTRVNKMYLSVMTPFQHLLFNPPASAKFLPLPRHGYIS